MTVSQRWPHPIVVALSAVPVTVVGAGAVAERKIAALLEGGASVTVVSPEATPSVEAWAAEGRLTLKRRPYRAGDLKGARLAYAATSRSEVNRAVRVEAIAEGVWLNVVDQPDLCDFITPAIVRRGDLTIAISTNGRAPALAKQIREDLERQFGADLAERVDEAARARPKTNVERSEVAVPLPGTTAGRVALVGAGPGDPELLTLKGRRLLEQADTVVYDALVSTRLLDFCSPSAERIFVGKRDSRHTLPQAEINELL
ncbi:MAG: siroheme synthase, partial [Acidobacteria bacterium]